MVKIAKKRSLVCFLLIAGVLATCYCIQKYNSIYHTIGHYPSGLNITFYDDQFSRGFSWWTKARKESETKLYLSEEPISEADLAEASICMGDIENDSIDGIYLIEGEIETVPDTTRWGRMFSIEYYNHTVSIKGLVCNQQYYYAIGGSGQYCYGEFQTESDAKTTIVNFNDFQTSDGSQLFRGGQTLNAALAIAETNVDFFAFGGDFTSTFSIENQSYNRYLGWIKSRDSLSEYVNSTPLVMAPGNHDAAGGLFTSNNTILYDGCSDNGGYYSFDHNNVHFITLNSNDFGQIQYNWLREDLKSANANKEITWIILMIHKGPYTTGDHGLSMEENFVKDLAYLCSTYHVDLVLQAHDHTYSKTLPYLWNSVGVTNSETNHTVINDSVTTVTKNNVVFDWNPGGTYYISCGASGHRVGENTDYALPYGEKSFRNRQYKVVASEIKVDSVYADIGDTASMDVGHGMFGTIVIDRKLLVYEFFVVDDNGLPVLFDRLAISKENIDIEQ